MGGLLNEEQQKEIIEDLTKEMSKEEEIEDLKKYYKRVCICQKCSKPFGSDTIEENNQFCPNCNGNGHKRRNQDGL